MLILNLEALHGRGIWPTAVEMCAAARRLNLGVSVKFNGVSLTAMVGARPDDIVAAYHNELASNHPVKVAVVNPPERHWPPSQSAALPRRDAMLAERAQENRPTSTFKCASCHNVFDKGWSDEEAAAERDKNFPDLNDTEAAIVCETCYREMMGQQPIEQSEK